ncbi:hypothetical protein QBC43DRAFT_89598 [Cladorrhinum sp. PSN259]|nr:hypothetical protein QBC43DRAFT_89598 [Cladorrhinum sp. PSN259]
MGSKTNSTSIAVRKACFCGFPYSLVPHNHSSTSILLVSHRGCLVGLTPSRPPLLSTHPLSIFLLPGAGWDACLCLAIHRKGLVHACLASSQRAGCLVYQLRHESSDNRSTTIHMQSRHGCTDEPGLPVKVSSSNTSACLWSLACLAVGLLVFIQALPWLHEPETTFMTRSLRYWGIRDRLGFTSFFNVGLSHRLYRRLILFQTLSIFFSSSHRSEP